MQKILFSFSGIREARLIGYGWNTERLIKETGAYVTADNPVDALLQAGAGAVHVLTGISESIYGDAVRLFQRPENRVALEHYEGSAPRTSSDVTEGLAAMGNVFHGKFGSVLTLPIIILKTPGDVLADFADGVAGVRRN